MSSKPCCVCGRSFPDTFTVTYALTAEEKVTMQNPPDEVYYCNPCHQVMKDPTAGADLLQSLYEMRLRERGVVRAKELAALWRSNLVKLIKPKLN